jgi:hypothetical protein
VQNRKAAGPASHHGMPPKTERLTKTQETPVRKKPIPKARPVSRPCRGLAASSSSQKNPSQTSGANQNRPKGAKLPTPTTPMVAAIR